MRLLLFMYNPLAKLSQAQITSLAFKTERTTGRGRNSPEGGPPSTQASLLAGLLWGCLAQRLSQDRAVPRPHHQKPSGSSQDSRGLGSSSCPTPPLHPEAPQGPAGRAWARASHFPPWLDPRLELRRGTGARRRGAHQAPSAQSALHASP